MNPQRLISSSARAFRGAAHYSFLPQRRVMDVAIFGRNIEIAAKNNRHVRLVVVVEETAQPSHPVQLKLKLL